MKPLNISQFLIAISSLSFSIYSVAETQGERLLVNKAISAIDICYHWGGEIGDQTEERNHEIENGINKDCPKAKKIAIQAFRKYPNNSRLYEPILHLSEIYFFILSEEDKTRLCSSNVENLFCK